MRCWKQASILKALALCILLASSASHSDIDSDSAERYQLNVESQTVEQALRSLANASGRQLLFPYDQMEALKSISISGRYTLEEALGIILKDTSLSGELTTEGVILVTPIQKKSDRGSEMKNRKKILAATVAFFAGAGSATGVFGQEVGSGGGEMDWLLEEVVVTAQKREQNLTDVPISIAVVSGRELEQAGIVSLHDLSYSVPSLTVTESSPGRQTVTIRGVGNTRGTSSLIGLYLDEAAVSGAPEEQMDVRAIDLARVEVLRGPQGTLYGAGSTGGAIRYITNNPSLESFSGKVNLSAYDTDKGDMSQELTAVLDVPVIEGVFGLRIAGAYDNKGGWVDQPAASRENINDNELVHLRVKGLWRATDMLDIKGTVIVHRDDIGGSSYVNFGPNEDSNYLSAVDPLAESPGFNDYDFYNLTFTYDLDFASLLSASSYANMEREWVNGFFFPGDGFTFDGLQQKSQTTTIFTQELRLNSSGDGPMHWTTGVFYREYENEELDDNDNIFNGFRFANAVHTIEESKSIAVFGDVSYELTDRLEAGIGARYFEDDREFLDIVGGTPLQKGSFDEVSPRVYASYAVSDGSNVYLNIGTGFRSGGFNRQVAIDAGADPEYSGEELVSYEVGTKMSLLDGHVDAELALFQSNYKDFISVGVIGSSVTSQTNNIGEAEIKGLEVSVTWRPVENLILGFSGNIIDAEVASIDGAGTPQIVGDKLDTVPDYGYSLSVDYQFSWDSQIEGFARVNYNEQGEANFTLRNSGLTPGTEILQSDKLTFLNANLGADFDTWSVELFGENLLNDAGWTTPYGPVFGISPQARPRTLGVKVGIEF